MRTLAIKPGALVVRGVSKAAANWFALAFIIRTLAMVGIHIFSLNHGFGGFYPLASGHDDGGYFASASAIAGGADVGPLPSLYPLVLGLIYSVTGPDLMVGKFINVLAGSIAVAIGVLLARDLAREEALLDGQSEAEIVAAGERAANLAGLFLTFYPSLLWYSTQLVKDPILIMFGMWALLLGVRLLRRPSFWPALAWLFAFCGLFAFRTYAALTLGLSIVLFTVRFRRNWILPILLIAGVGPMAVGQGPFGWYQIQPWLDTERLESFREVVYSTGGSAAGVQVDYSSGLGFLMTYPYSLATAMFGPLPWQVRSASVAVALPEAMVLWALIGVWARGFMEIWRGRPGRVKGGYTALPMLFSVVLIASVALFSDNIGANTRLRLLPWCAFLVFAAVRLDWPLSALVPFKRLKSQKPEGAAQNAAPPPLRF